MTATTPNYAIPYPEITDFVKDGATAMEAIAEKVDDIFSSGAAARNILYNGAMQVAQRGVGPVTGITGSGYNTADRWKLFLNTAGTWTQTVDTDVPTGQGFRNSLKMTCTTAKASLGASDFLGLHQMLEGLDLQAIRKGTANAQPLVLSFWVKSNKTGNYICELFDSDNNRSVSKSYTVNASGTWEYKTVAFPADTTGQFTNDNNLSLEVNWWLASGTTFTSGTLQTTWGTLTNANRAVGVTNLASDVNNYWQVTGAQLTIGVAAVPFQFKSYNQELAECQRYYTRFTGGDAYSLYAIGFARDGASADLVFYAPVTMRRSPTAIEFSNLYMTRPGVATVAITGMSMGDGRGPSIGGVYVTGAFTANQQYFLGNNNNTAGYVAFFAELT